MIEKLVIEKINEESMQNVLGGRGPINTGCSDAPDCSTGDGDDSVPFDPDLDTEPTDG